MDSKTEPKTMRHLSNIKATDGVEKTKPFFLKCETCKIIINIIRSNQKTIEDETTIQTQIVTKRCKHMLKNMMERTLKTHETCVPQGSQQA